MKIFFVRSILLAHWQGSISDGLRLASALCFGYNKNTYLFYDQFGFEHIFNLTLNIATTEVREFMAWGLCFNIAAKVINT